MDTSTSSGQAQTPSSHDMAHVTSRLHADHINETSRMQKAADHATSIVARPSAVVALAIGIVLWISLNLVAPWLGYRPFETSPFPTLDGLCAMAGLIVAVLILSTQRREDQLASTRAQLILELAVLTDQKLSKIIQLLEEGRRDNPAIADRIDEQAASMSTPSDPLAVLVAIREVDDELL